MHYYVTNIVQIKYSHARVLFCAAGGETADKTIRYNT